MKATFIDCPPFLHELYRGDLDEIVPNLSVNVGSPAPGDVIRLLEGSVFAMNDHTTMDATLLAGCPSLRSIVFLGTGAASFIDLTAAEAAHIGPEAHERISLEESSSYPKPYAPEKRSASRRIKSAAGRPTTFR